MVPGEVELHELHEPEEGVTREGLQLVVLQEDDRRVRREDGQDPQALVGAVHRVILAGAYRARSDPRIAPGSVHGMWEDTAHAEEKEEEACITAAHFV